MDPRRVSALALTVGLLAGCGSDGDADPGAEEAGSADVSTSSPDVGAGYGGSPASGGSEEAAGTVTMTITDFTFEVPDAVAPGAEITVTNEDSVGHTVTSDDDGATFDVAVGPGETVTFTAPDEAGEYAFHCRPHPAMTATLVVEG